MSREPIDREWLYNVLRHADKSGLFDGPAKGHDCICYTEVDALVNAYEQYVPLMKRIAALEAELARYEGAEVALWRVKDYGDGWIYCRSKQAAEREAENGNLVQCLIIKPAKEG